jgi:hypothetical protein
MRATLCKIEDRHETAGTHVVTWPVEAEVRESSHTPCIAECEQCHILLTGL